MLYIIASIINFTPKIMKEDRKSVLSSDAFAVFACTLLAATAGCSKGNNEAEKEDSSVVAIGEEVDSAVVAIGEQVDVLKGRITECLEQCRALEDGDPASWHKASDLQNDYPRLVGESGGLFFRTILQMNSNNSREGKEYSEELVEFIKAIELLAVDLRMLNDCLSEYDNNKNRKHLALIMLLLDRMELDLRKVEECKFLESLSDIYSALMHKDPSLEICTCRVDMDKERCSQLLADKKVIIDKFINIEGILSMLLASLSRSSTLEFENHQERLLGLQTRVRDIIKYLQQNDFDNREDANNSENEPSTPIFLGTRVRSDGNEGRPPVTPPDMRDWIRKKVKRA